jgi:hypothetical protein
MFVTPDLYGLDLSVFFASSRQRHRPEDREQSFGVFRRLWRWTSVDPGSPRRMRALPCAGGANWTSSLFSRVSCGGYALSDTDT